MSLTQMTNTELLTYYKEHSDTEVLNECLRRMGEVVETPNPDQISMEEYTRTQREYSQSFAY